MSKTKEDLKKEIGIKHGLMMHDPIQSYHMGNAMEEYAKEVCSPRWVDEELNKIIDQIQQLRMKSYRENLNYYDDDLAAIETNIFKMQDKLEESNTEGEPDLVASNNALSNDIGDAPFITSNSIEQEWDSLLQFNQWMEWLMNDRLFFVDEVRKWLRQYDKEEISFSKFVELLNEKVFNKYHQGENLERSVALEDAQGSDAGNQNRIEFLESSIKEIEKEIERLEGVVREQIEKDIETEMSQLNEQDVNGFVWWNRFKEFIQKHKHH